MAVTNVAMFLHISTGKLARLNSCFQENTKLWNLFKVTRKSMKNVLSRFQTNCCYVIMLTKKKSLKTGNLSSPVSRSSQLKLYWKIIFSKFCENVWEYKWMNFWFTKMHMWCFAQFGTIFVEFKKCEKRPWRSITFSKVAGLYVKEFYLNM